MGVREILVISTPRDLPQYSELLGDGSKIGVEFTYIEQHSPGGLPQAFLLGEDFIGEEKIVLILGDNIFHSENLSELLLDANERHSGATIFGIEVPDPEGFGIAQIGDGGEILRIVEKPKEWVGNTAVTGLYIYDSDVVGITKELTPSARGELEISELNQIYLDQGRLSLLNLGKEVAWMDTGTFEGLFKASEYVRIMHNNENSIVGDLDLIAKDLGLINSI
jgi:glucose-1-phosphate thymidylyltransferase